MRRTTLTAFPVLWLAACTGIGGGPSPAVVAGYDWAGLEPIEMRDIDIAAVDPAVDFGAYTKLIVDPVEVSLDEDWVPTGTGSRLEASPRDLEELRQEIAQAVHDGLVDEISEGQRYTMVQEAGPGVLRIHARLVDVRLNAPDLRSASRIEQYARSAGEWTLVTDLIDAGSGAVVGRLVDRWVDPEEQYMTRMTRVENTRALQRATEAWARAVRRHLDVADIRNRMEGAGEGLRPTGGG